MPESFKPLPADVKDKNSKLPKILQGSVISRSFDGRMVHEVWDIYVNGNRSLRLIAELDVSTEVATCRVLKPKRGGIV